MRQTFLGGVHESSEKYTAQVADKQSSEGTIILQREIEKTEGESCLFRQYVHSIT